MTIRQSAGLDTMHQDIRLCGWTRASPAEVANDASLGGCGQLLAPLIWLDVEDAKERWPRDTEIPTAVRWKVQSVTFA